MKKYLLIVVVTLLSLVGCADFILTDSTNSTSLAIKNFNELRLNSGYEADFKAIGEQKILVLPVKFKNYNYCQTTCDTVLNELDAVFFGKTEDTGWESVNSYYQKTSYNKLNITGKVAPQWFEIDKTISQLNSLSTAFYPDPATYVLRNVVEQYKRLYDDISDFDTDGDGNIDLVWMVYDSPYDINGTNDILWAYTFWDYDNSNAKNKTKSNPYGYTYAWASYGFMYDGGYALPDAHTFIHETGHALGLDDYYNYDSGDVNAPAGGLDMMDYNIGDNNAYSKYLLDWVQPEVLNSNRSVTIAPFESSGDFILIPSQSYNNMAMSEYLIIEFYTPTGLNYLDATSKYAGFTPNMFTTSGVKIYHVDSRIGLFNHKNKFVRYTDTVSGNNYLAIAHSNTPSYSVNRNYALLHLLEESGVNTFKTGSFANNNTLFYEGDTFTPQQQHKNLFYNIGKFNDGSTMNFTLTISSITSTGATITYQQL